MASIHNKGAMASIHSKDATALGSNSGSFNESYEKEDIKDYMTETRPWYKVPHLRLLCLHVFTITLTSTVHGFDGSMLNGLQSLEHWRGYMGKPTGHVLGALSAAPLFGVISIFFIAPFLCDRYGRKFVIFFGQSIMLVGAILQGLATNYAFFLVSRYIIGLGYGIGTVGSPTLISEIAYPTHREVSTFAYNICWYLGAFLAAIVIYGTRNIDSNWSWRIPSYLQGLFPAIQLLMMLWVPESPRFLIAKGRVDDARAVLHKHHVGGSDAPEHSRLVEFEIHEIQAALEAETMSGSTASYKDFIHKKSYRKRLFLVLFTATIGQLSGNGLVSYYLNKVLNSIGITDKSEQLLINMCLMLFNLVVASVACCTAGYFRRRTMFLTCVIGMLVCYIVWTALSAINQQRNFEDKSLANGVLAMIFLYYLSYDIGANGLPLLYMTEVLPYSHRSKGINIYQLWQQIVLVYNAFVNPIAMDAIEWKYYIVYCCIIAVEVVVVYFFYPETSGRTLEEVAEVFGDKAIDQVRPPVFAGESLRKQSIEHIERASV